MWSFKKKISANNHVRSLSHWKLRLKTYSLLVLASATAIRSQKLLRVVSVLCSFINQTHIYCWQRPYIGCWHWSICCPSSFISHKLRKIDSYCATLLASWHCWLCWHIQPSHMPPWSCAYDWFALVWRAGQLFIAVAMFLFADGSSFPPLPFQL